MMMKSLYASNKSPGIVGGILDKLLHEYGQGSSPCDSQIPMVHWIWYQDVISFFYLWHNRTILHSITTEEFDSLWARSSKHNQLLSTGKLCHLSKNVCEVNLLREASITIIGRKESEKDSKHWITFLIVNTFFGKNHSFRGRLYFLSCASQMNGILIFHHEFAKWHKRCVCRAFIANIQQTRIL